MSETLPILPSQLGKEVNPKRFIELLRYRHELAQIDNKVAIVEKKHQLTYKQLWEAVDMLSANFENVGIKKGDAVAICSPNSIQVCITFLALWQYGAIPFIINYKLESLGNLCELPLRYYLVPKQNAAVHRYFKDFDHFEQRTTEANLICYVNQEVQPKKIIDAAFLATSSGSSGKAKIIKLTDLGTYYNVKSNCSALSIKSDDVSALILPMGYSYGLVAQFLSHLYMGACLILLDTVFFFTQICQILNHFGVTNLFMVPPMIRQINYLHTRKLIQIDCPTLRFVTIGGNRIETSSVEKVIDIFKCKVVKTYGLAEAGPRVATNIVTNANHPTVESVGLPNQGIQIEILPSIPIKSYGIIKIHSPSVMSGYFNVRNPSSLKPYKSVTTKDLGYLDPAGNLFILGRRDNFFKLDKQVFWYREIENVLYKNFPFLKISIQKSGKILTIKVVAMYDFVIDLLAVYQSLTDEFGERSKKVFQIEVLKTNAMLNEK